MDQPPRTALVIVSSEVRGPGPGPHHVALDPQLRSMLQWVAASMSDAPLIQLGAERELQQVTGLVHLNGPAGVSNMEDRLPQC